MNGEEASRGRAPKPMAFWSLLFCFSPDLCSLSVHDGYIQAIVSPRLHLPSDILFVLSVLLPTLLFRLEKG